MSNFQLKGEKVYMNRFYLDKALGKGIQGVVLSAYDTVIRKKVAIKKLISNQKEDLIQHKKEIKVLKALNNAKITKGFPILYDYHTGKINYIVINLLGKR